MEITVPPKKEDRKQIKKGKGQNTKRNTIKRGGKKEEEGGSTSQLQKKRATVSVSMYS